MLQMIKENFKLRTTNDLVKSCTHNRVTESTQERTTAINKFQDKLKLF